MENPGPLPSPPTIGDSQTAILSAPPAQDPRAQFARLELERAIKNGANWFYWIAGLSLINSAIALSGSGMRFILGLGVTQIIDGVAQGLDSGAGLAVAVVLDLLAAAVFVFFGLFANKRFTWSFIAGMILYTMDGMIFLVFRDWFGVGHRLCRRGTPTAPGSTGGDAWGRSRLQFVQEGVHYT